MKPRLLLICFVFFGLLTVNSLFAQTVVTLAESSPHLTAVDPYANAANSADGLKPARPFWYSVDQKGLTILRIDDNSVVYRIPWPATIPVVQPDGEYLTVPAPASGWDPVAMTVTYPTEEALASNSETPPTFVYVVMAHSGFEWQSEANVPAGRDPHLRDRLAPSTNPDTESSMLVSVDVTDPTFDPGGESAGGPMIAGAILGHGAGQPAYDPGTDMLYIGNMPSRSLPADLQSFVSIVAAMAPPVGEPAGAGPPVPEPPLVNLCGPEHPDEGLLIGEPYVWACTESGDGPAVWEFQNLPPWLTAHRDKISGDLDGLVYGTPTANGTWMFLARVTDYGDPEMGPLTSDWYTVTVNVIATGVASEAEAGFEAGIPGGQGIGGTGDCTPVATSTPGSIVPSWIDVQPALVNGELKGCYVMGTAPISGQYYEFALPNFHFNAPFNYEPVILSGNVAGPYVFDPLPAGVTISGLAWHQIEKIHDPSTEADVLNSEFIGVEPFTGQLYKILPPQGTIETGDVTSAPEVSVETDKITTEGQPLSAFLPALRPDIAAQLTGNRGVTFGDVAVEVDRDIFVTVPWILDPTDATIIPIGGPSGSTIENGLLMKVSGGTASNIDLEKVQANYLGLNSNLAPAVPGVEPGQKDNGLLWVTGTNTGNVAVVDTALGQVAQSVSVSDASSLGGVSVDTGLGFAYVAGESLGSVTIFGTGTRPQRAPVIWSGVLATFNVGVPSSFSVIATGLPTPRLSYTGKLPDGVSFTDNGNGTATLAGTPPFATDGDYSFTITASNGVSPEATQAFILTVAGPPLFTTASTTTFTVGSAGSFLVATTGAPTATVLWCTDGADPAGPCTLPSWLTFVDNEDGTSTLGGTPPSGSEGTYTITFWASTGVPPDARQTFTLIVNGGQGTGTAPVITSSSSTSFTVGTVGTFTVVATGSPTPVVTYWGALPSGVIFVDNGNGTAVLTGTPGPGTHGSYFFTITATNGVVPNATQNFTLTVHDRPAITSASTAVFTVGSAGSFTVTATGSPMPTLSVSGSMPGGVTFTPNGDGTATLAGTPAAETGGDYALTITASNVVGSATQAFTLTVAGPPSVTVVTPNSGEKLFTTSPYTIQWGATNVAAGSTFTVSFSTNAGNTFTQVPGCAGGLYSTARSCVWNAPGPVTSNGRIRVELINAGNVVASDVSDAAFSVASSAPAITVMAPNTALTWAIGTVQTIRWNHNLGLNSSVNVDISRDGGASWSPIANAVKNATATAGSYVWTVTGPATTGAFVRVSWTDGAVTDASNVTFTIADPMVTVTVPNTAVNWAVGMAQVIRWNHNLGANTHYRIELTRDGATWETLNPDFLSTTGGTGSWNWTVTGPATTTAQVRVSWLGGTTTDSSNVNFTIAEPTVTVTAPNAPTNWAVGTIKTIRWTHNLGVNSHYQIELTRDGATWEMLNPDFLSTTAGAGSWNWTVTGPATTTAQVRVTWLGGTATDTSDVNFTIAVPTVTVTRPNTVLKWLVSTPQAIRWNHNLGANTHYLIELTRDGTTWETLNPDFLSTTAGAGSWDWIVTGPATTTAQVRVTWLGGTATDTSNVDFIIQ